MAKATRTKKAKEVIEEPITEINDTVIEQPEIAEETPIPEVVEEIIVPEPLKEAPVINIVESEKKDGMTMEEKITAFINSRDGGEIKLNDFLKSLYPLPRFNEPPQWLQQAVSRQLKAILEGMKQKGEITIINDMHRQLGASYYPDTETGRQHHYNLNTLQIIAKK